MILACLVLTWVCLQAVVYRPAMVLETYESPGWETGIRGWSVGIAFYSVAWWDLSFSIRPFLELDYGRLWCHRAEVSILGVAIVVLIHR